ncbi:MAG: DUF1549 domain-containing protein, partial [Isosphaeraceae bacterium]
MDPGSLRRREPPHERIGGRRIWCALLAVWLGTASATGSPGGVLADEPSASDAVHSLFEARCLRCHNGKVRKGGLDLSTHASLMEGGESGAVVVPGKPEESPLFEMVRDGAMPADRKGRLSPGEVDRLRTWIEEGALGGTGENASPGANRSVAVSQHDVYPILLRRCVVCHGRDAREAGLDLRSRDAMLRGGESGPALVPFEPGKSLILTKIRSGDMPPLRRVIEASIKPIEPSETAVIERWIASGAPEVEIAPDVASFEPDPMVTDEDREFWAFRPPGPVDVPSTGRPDLVRNPIDAFVLDKLAGKGLSLSPEADRATLLRRVTLDLTGLPPEPAELDAFLDDQSIDAYERVIDRLLASPRHGERWGRHWLDVAGYADTDGKREQDLSRPFAWRYRDYVIRSLNADKPYDRFLTEQIAGDELVDYEHAPVITQEIEDVLVATGFLRMAPDPTWANQTNFVPDRLDVIADEMDVLGSGVLGLTLKCARCHSHKFDPIPQRDYYRLLAVFKGAFDEHDWLRSGWEPAISKGRRADRELPFVTTAERRRWESHNEDVKRDVEEKKARLEAEAASARERSRRTGQAKPPSNDHKALAALDPAFKEVFDRLSGEIKALEARVLPEPTIRALWDRGEPSPTYVYRRGDPLNPGPLVGPGVPSVLTDGRTPFEFEPPRPGSRSTGRRLALARWLTRPDHPLTARVIVNRVWKHHFANGLVVSLGNFGKAGSPPTHPELLDWLAGEFVRRSWSLKELHRLIVTSATYRQTSNGSVESRSLDSDGALHSRYPLKRLEAEALLDSTFQIAGRLDPKPFGPPDPVTARADGLVTPNGTDRGWRRSVYSRQNRKNVTTILEAFDFPLMNPNCLE